MKMTRATITDLSARAAVEFRDRAYVARKTGDGWISLTFGEVHVRARRFAAWLLGQGFAKGDRFALLADGSPEWIVAELGVMLAAGVSVPLSFKLLAEEIPFRLDHSGAAFLAVSRHTSDKCCSILGRLEKRIRLVYLDDDEDRFSEELVRFGVPRDGAVLFSECIAVTETEEIRERLDRIEEGISEDDVATISYTSGTVGNPKGVMLTHGNYYYNSLDSVNVFEIVPREFETLLILPCDHSYAHTVGLYCALHRGISVSFVDARSGPVGMARNIPANLVETNPVFLLTVPALTGSFMKRIVAGVEERGGLVKLLFDIGLRTGMNYHGDGCNVPPFRVRLRNFFLYRIADKLVFSRIRKSFGCRLGFFVGGGALHDMKQQEFFRALGIVLYQGYGLTEASPVISANTPKSYKLGTSGKMLPHVSCMILKSDGKPAGIDEIGEICVRGKTVMKGYYRNEAATEEALRDGWLHTGDLGFVDEDGFLVVVGREKALLISDGGEKYSPEEIEEAIANISPVVRQILLYNDHRKYTSALVVLDEDGVRKLAAGLGIEEPRALLDAVTDSIFSFRKDAYYGRRFPPQWLPVTFRLLEEPFSEQNLLMNSSLKMVRYRIHERYRDEIEYLYSDEGSRPNNPVNLEVLEAMLGS